MHGRALMYTEISELVFGTGPDLEVWQMAARAAAIFCVALILIRASGRRSFGQQSPFDACITVLIGAVLSRAVAGASPFWPTVAAGATLVAIHRALALASLRWVAVENLVTGAEIELVKDGRVNAKAMSHALVTRRNLDEAIRQKLGDANIDAVALAIMERDGKITVIQKR
ncbi:MAG: hypothetical protein JWQ73_1421 [Variovorax sp.]|nr:hypothetical protein [Variovorax sp.]